MSQEFTDLNNEDQLRTENDFLKMKLMLQHGAAFEGETNNKIPPEVENEFLNNVLSFEDQFAQGRRIRIFDKIGKPEHFRPVGVIPDDEIDKCWMQLQAYLVDHGIHLDACSPNISCRELYRFTTLELFQQETDDINIPGMMIGYIYDEFYPDPIYESQKAVEEFFQSLFNEKGFHDFFYYLHDEGVSLNGESYDGPDALKSTLNKFKLDFSEMELIDVSISTSEVNDGSVVIVKGKYQAQAFTPTQHFPFDGAFQFTVVPGDIKIWYIKDIYLEGFNL